MHYTTIQLVNFTRFWFDYTLGCIYRCYLALPLAAFDMHNILIIRLSFWFYRPFVALVQIVLVNLSFCSYSVNTFSSLHTSSVIMAFPRLCSRSTYTTPLNSCTSSTSLRFAMFISFFLFLDRGVTDLSALLRFCLNSLTAVRTPLDFSSGKKRRDVWKQTKQRRQFYLHKMATVMQKCGK